MPSPGILALQGGFEAHSRSLDRLGFSPVLVKTKTDLETVNCLFIPGGESTVMIRLLKNYDLLDPLKERIRDGLPVFGTCAGMILLSSGIEGMDQETLGIMDIRVRRNAYGRQIDSFETELSWLNKGAGRQDERIPAVFIRAPRITYAGRGVDVLVEHEGSPVLVRQGACLAASFHPELTDSLEVHRFFMNSVGTFL